MSVRVGRGPAIVFSIVLAIVLPGSARAQPGWFTAAVNDSVAFLEHKSASSILLLASREIRVDDEGHARTHVRLVRKLLSAKALADREGFLNEFESERMEVRAIKGWRMDRSGRLEVLRDENIARVSPQGLQAIFAHGGVVVAGFRDLTFGDIVGYEYDIEDREPYATYQRHSFQIQEPVRRSSFSLTIPKGWKVQSFGWEIDSARYEVTGLTHTWTVRDLAYRADEPMMPSWSFLERELKVTVSPPEGNRQDAYHFLDWPAVCRRAAGLNDPAVERTPAIASLAESLSAQGRTPLEKVAAVAGWVQSSIRYVAVEVGPGRWAPHTASSVMGNGYGDCKDKVAIFRSLLGAIGIPSVAVLANTSSFVDSAVPSLYQFNHVIAAIPDSALGSVPQLESVRTHGWVFFDPTDPAQPFGMLPPPLRGGRVLVLSGESPPVMRLPHGKPDTYRRFQRAEITLTYPDTLRARVSIHDVGPIAHYRKYMVTTTSHKERLESIRANYARRYRSFDISNYTTAFSGDTSLTEFVLTIRGLFSAMGEKFYVKPNIFPFDHILPLSSPVRRYPVWFGASMTVVTEVVLDAGHSWIPEKREMTFVGSCMDAASLEYDVSYRDGRVLLDSKFTSFGSLVGVNDYSSARKFSSDVQQFNDLTVTIKQGK